MRALIVGMLGLVVAGCVGGGKGEVDEDFSDLGALDEKSDAFSYRLRMLGRLDAGDSRRALYTSTPRFRGYDFMGRGGERVDIWVRSSRGDALTWLLDDKFRLVAKNDDADETTLDSRIEAVLPDRGGAEARFFIVMRDYELESHYFTTALTVAGDEPVAPPEGDWQAQAMETASRMIQDVDSLAPFQIDAASLPPAGQARLAAAAVLPTATAYKLVLEGRDVYLILAREVAESGVAAVDLIDDVGAWFAHGYSPEPGSLFWSLFETDQTICNCRMPSNGMASCTWIDGSVVESSVMICD